MDENPRKIQFDEDKQWSLHAALLSMCCRQGRLQKFRALVRKRKKETLIFLNHIMFS
jgi:pentatricopeptide repeat protein